MQVRKQMAQVNPEIVWTRSKGKARPEAYLAGTSGALHPRMERGLSLDNPAVLWRLAHSASL